MNQYLQSNQENFNKAIEFFKKEISHLRTGRANPNLLEGIFVEAYGAKTPLNGLANINVSDGHSIVVSPWDKKVIKDIEKAIVEADLGVGVVNEGDKVRITIPVMTEENRRELVKKLNEKMEECRISFRQIRDQIKSEIETSEKNKEISEDDSVRLEKEVQRLTDDTISEIDNLGKKKEEELMAV